MKFHWLAEDGSSGTDDLKFGSSLKRVIYTAGRASYVVIDRREFEDATMSEKQMLLYMRDIKTKHLTLGGKIYIEATI